jgi:hypothetical protein
MADPVVRTTFGNLPAPVNGYVSNSLNVITAISPNLGCVVLVPVPLPNPNPNKYAAYYNILAYITTGAGPAVLQFPDDKGVVVVDLPDGFATPIAAIEAALDAEIGGGGSNGVGPS